MKLRIPLAQPEITSADRNAVMDVLRTPALSCGPKVVEFERALCDYAGVPHAVAVNSGTSALHLAVEGLDLVPDAEVILPSFAFAAPLNVLLQKHLVPVFVDIDAESLNISAGKIEDAITKRTRAIIAVHTFGRPCDMATICGLAKKHNLYVIEDACEAIGAEIDGRKIGVYGDVSVLAFYPNKQITAGEGGALLTPNEKMANRARRLRNQGRDAALDWYQQVEAGFSYRISDINCALAISQLKRIDEILVRRQRLAEIYELKLRELTEIQRPSISIPNGKNSWFCYVVQLDASFNRQDRDRLCKLLMAKGIGCARYFAPLHRQPVVAYMAEHLHLPITDHAADRVLALPFFNQMTESDVDEVVSALAESLAELRRN